MQTSEVSWPFPVEGRRLPPTLFNCVLIVSHLGLSPRQLAAGSSGSRRGGQNCR